MINKKYKLNLKEYPNFFHQFIKIQSNYFLFFYRKSSQKYPLINIIVPKKNIKKKVERSLIKRRIYAIFRQNLTLIPDIKIIIVILPLIYKLSYRELNTEICQKCLSKIPKNN